MNNAKNVSMFIQRCYQTIIAFEIIEQRVHVILHCEQGSLMEVSLNIVQLLYFTPSCFELWKYSDTILFRCFLCLFSVNNRISRCQSRSHRWKYSVVCFTLYTPDLREELDKPITLAFRGFYERPLRKDESDSTHYFSPRKISQDL